MSAQRAYEIGMVNQVVPREELTDATMSLAGNVAEMPTFGLSLT
jgi:enoyl-CoA hydratase